jgi:hypothetical protein
MSFKDFLKTQFKVKKFNKLEKYWHGMKLNDFQLATACNFQRCIFSNMSLMSEYNVFSQCKLQVAAMFIYCKQKYRIYLKCLSKLYKRVLHIRTKRKVHLNIRPEMCGF